MSAQVIAAEDTRTFSDLCRRMGIDPPGHIVSYFEGNEIVRTGLLVNQIYDGATVVLVTDAGMPSISDPGFRLVAACVNAGLPVSAIPGPSAVITALALSGLPTHRFCFEGFLPRKSGKRQSRLQGLAHEERTMVFFEAPHRLRDFLTDAATIFGSDRRGAICREMTKPHEEVVRGTLTELVAWAESSVRGEVTVVISGETPEPPSMEEMVARVQALMADGVKYTTAVRKVAAKTGTDRHELWDRMEELRYRTETD